MTSLTEDLRCARRALSSRPGLTVAALLTLALGIGANTVIFTMIEGILIHPLPYRDAERIVYLRTTLPQGETLTESAYSELLRACREQADSLEQIESYVIWNYLLTGEHEPLGLLGARVSPGVFSLLGIEPLLGRLLFPDVSRPGMPEVAVLGHELWQSRFGGDPDIVGRTVHIDTEPYEVVGVMPPEAHLIDPYNPIRLWMPLVPKSDTRVQPSTRTLARLRKGASATAAQAELDVITSRLRHRGEDGAEPWLIVETVRDQVRPLFGLIFLYQLAVGCVLLIACANVAYLLVALGDGRSRELALRKILGASRRRLLRQLLTESLVLSLLGGALGLLLALWGLDALLALIPTGHLSHLRPQLNGTVLVFTTLLSLGTGVVVGLLPALRGSSTDLEGALKSSSAQTGASRRSRILHQSFVVFEVTLAVTLLAGAGFLISSFLRLSAVPVGFTADDILTMVIKLPEDRYVGSRRKQGFAAELLASVRGTGLATEAALAAGGPLDFVTAIPGTIEVEGRPIDGKDSLPIPVAATSPGYFRTLGIPLLLGGRDFLDQDRESPQRLVILSESAAKRYWPGRNPVGRRFRFAGMQEGFRVVGVAGNVRHYGPASPDDRVQLYVPFWQWPKTRLTLFVRSPRPRSALIPMVEQQIRNLEPDALIETAALEDRVAAAIPNRSSSLLMALLATIAMVLASVGIYSIVAYTVSRRTREIGLRMALGARGRDVVRQIALYCLPPVAVGIFLGLIGSLATARLLRSYVTDFVGWEAAVCGVVVVLATGWSLAAIWLPTRRAAGLEPTVALRHE